MSHNAPPPDTRARAFQRYCEEATQKVIAEEFGLSEKTLSNWKRQGQWEALRGPAALPGNVPPWALRVLAVLAAQQQQLARIEAFLHTLSVPLAPATKKEQAAH
jgi:transposase-like protein